MATDDADPPRRRAAALRPVALAALVGSAALAAVAGTAWAAATVPVTARDAVVLALLLALEIGYVETLRLVGPRPGRRSAPRRGDLVSVAVLAGAVLLPPAAAVLLALVAHLYEPRRLALPPVPPQRAVHRVATTVLACLAVWAVREWVVGGAPAIAAGLPFLLLAMAVFALVKCGLVVLGAALVEPRRALGGLLGGVDDNLPELATLALGGLAAAAVAASPWLLPSVLPAMIVMRRAVLVPQLTEDGHVDGKTGLLNAATWQERAAADLAAARPDEAPRAVLVIDLDHFKAVNDTHGHLAGDAVLAAVAEAVRGSVRARDLVGRFGGEEFVVLVAPADGGGAADVEVIAERIRRRVAELRVAVDTADGTRHVSGLRVSIGAGMQRAGGHPAGRGDLGELVRLADEAVYAAKRAGRDQVRVSALTPHP